MMENLLEKAAKFLQDNPSINEVELTDGFNKVRVVRNSPCVFTSYPYTYQVQYPVITPTNVKPY